MNGDAPHALVDRLYALLGDGDVVALASLLDGGFRAELIPNLPFGWGERAYVGPGDMILRGWGARLDAWFADVWRMADGRFVALRQITDTAAWRLAATDTVLPGQRRR